jgi:hypothetical protein
MLKTNSTTGPRGTARLRRRRIIVVVALPVDEAKGVTLFHCAGALAGCQRESRLTSSRLWAGNTYCARPGPFRVDEKDGPGGSPIGGGLRWFILLAEAGLLNGKRARRRSPDPPFSRRRALILGKAPLKKSTSSVFSATKRFKSFIFLRSLDSRDFSVGGSSPSWDRSSASCHLYKVCHGTPSSATLVRSPFGETHLSPQSVTL